MYTVDAPASGIHELLAFLKREDDNAYLYRGQVEHYGSVLPSVFRKARTGSMYAAPYWHEIDSNKFHQELAVRGQLRFRLLTFLIEELGRGVGNLVAQQYGLGSEAIDVTVDPDIAAFFATRDYPAYDHVDGSGKQRLGVIYRFPKGDAVKSFEELEDKLDRLGHFAGEPPEARWFDEVLYRPRLQELPDRARAVFDAHGQEELLLFTKPIIVEYGALTEYLLEGLATTLRFVPGDFDRTRISRQRGGFIRPPVHWLCRVPATRYLDTAYLKQYRAYTPSLVVAERLVAVEDTMALPGLEVFFFRHSAERVESISRKDLWPSAPNDDIYQFLLDVCLDDRRISEYLEQHDIWLEHPDKGVIDRGFYTGTEIRAWDARVALRDGDPGRALLLLDDVLTSDTDNPDLYVLRGTLAFQQGRLQEALDNFDSALGVEPGYWPALANRAAVLQRQGLLEGSIQDLSRAIDMRSGRPELYTARAHAYAALSRPDLTVADCDTALTLVDKSARARPKLLDLLHLKALALTAWGKDGDAESVLEQLAAFMNVARLRKHIEGMRAARPSSGLSPSDHST